MALFIMIIILFLLGSTVIWIYGKGNIKRIIAPLLILLISDFLLLYAKFIEGETFLALILYFPAIALLIISVIWFIILLIIGVKRKYNKRKMLAIVMAFGVTAIILFIPALTKEDKFKLNENDYIYVSEAIFEAYDEGKMEVGDQFHSPPYSTMDEEELVSIFPAEVINKMKKLNKNAGVYTYIVADEDVVYFSFGSFFQSINGIAITRNGKDPSTDQALKTRYFDGATSFDHITDHAYYFYDGL